MTSVDEMCKHGHPRTAENTNARGNCKICNRISAAKWQQENPEKRQENLQKFIVVHQHDAEMKLRLKENSRRWALENPEKAVARAIRYQKRNPEKHREWRNTAQRNRRARKNNSPGQFTTAAWLVLKDSFGGVCLACGKAEEVLISLGLALLPDHVRPLAKEGTNELSNIQPLCHGKGGCNNRKHTKWIDYRGGFALEII